MGPNAGVCSHFIIGKFGEVYQCADPNWAAGANCCPSSPSPAVGWFGGSNANYGTWSIELVKNDINNQDILTLAQFQAVVDVSYWLCNVCQTKGIWADGSGGIMSHSFLDPVHRPNNNDPGPFDWQTYLLAMGGDPMAFGITITTPGVSAFFEEIVVNGDVRWRRKGTDIIIRGGLLQDYKNYPIIPGYAELGAISDWGLPVRSEYPHPDNPKVVVMDYERKRRQFDMSRLLDNPPGVKTNAYSGHVDHLYPLPDQVNKLTQRVHDLEAAPYQAAVTQIRSVLQPLP